MKLLNTIKCKLGQHEYKVVYTYDYLPHIDEYECFEKSVCIHCNIIK